jgi:hypothetical protein
MKLELSNFTVTILMADLVKAAASPVADHPNRSTTPIRFVKRELAEAIVPQTFDSHDGSSDPRKEE